MIRASSRVGSVPRRLTVGVLGRDEQWQWQCRQCEHDQGGDFTKPFLKYFKNGSEKPVFISFSLHFTIVDYYPPSFHFILTMRVFGENGFFWINWKGRVKSLGKVSNRATYLS